MTEAEIRNGYERETGNVIVETFRDTDPMHIPGVLVYNQAPFNDPHDAVHNAVVLEECAKMALHTYALNPAAQPMDQALLDKHFLRKHGANAYYGQSTAERG